MGEKLYRPIIKDGDHLVRSSKNPNRVRGQSRDADNKNPDIVEWEEVDEDDVFPERRREELEYELEQRAYEERRAEQDRALSTVDSINSGLELVNNVLIFLNENPEVAAALISGGKKLKNFVSGGFKKATLGIKSLFAGNQKTKAEQIIEKERLKENTAIASEVIIETETDPLVEADVVNDSSDVEDMSIDEARNLIIETLANYINMKRNMERLSRAKINNVDMPQLDMKQVLEYMDSVVDKYPALIDEKTSVSVLDILHGNSDIAENKQILVALRIETDLTNETKTERNALLKSFLWDR